MLLVFWQVLLFLAYSFFCTAVDVYHTHIRARMKQRAAFKVMYSQAPEEEERRDPDDDDDDDSGRVTLTDGRRVPNGQKTPEVRIRCKNYF